ncbi:helix-turn-helix domain-containing protein [Dubosiella newyorkensis]
MAKRIQTTFEQRMEAVQWYEENGRSYKDTAAHFGYNYAQVRDWVKKYESSGEDGLLDRRGQRKEEAELTETERLKRELILERNKRKQLEMENELLKKLNELERG